LFFASANDAGRKPPLPLVLCVRMSYRLRSWFILLVMWHPWLLCSQLFLPANQKQKRGAGGKSSITTATQQQNSTRPTTWRRSASWFLQDSFATKLQNTAEGKKPGLPSTTIHNFVFQIQSLSQLITLSWYNRKLHLQFPSSVVTLMWQEKLGYYKQIHNSPETRPMLTPSFSKV